MAQAALVRPVRRGPLKQFREGGIRVRPPHHHCRSWAVDADQTQHLLRTNIARCVCIRVCVCMSMHCQLTTFVYLHCMIFHTCCFFLARVPARCSQGSPRAWGSLLTARSVPHTPDMPSVATEGSLSRPSCPQSPAAENNTRNVCHSSQRLWCCPWLGR